MSNLRYAKYQDPNATAIDDPNKVVELTATEVSSTRALVSGYGVRPLYTLPAPSSMSGTTETVLAQFVIPAGLLGVLDRLEMRFSTTKSGTADTGTIRFRCGTAGTTADTLLSTHVMYDINDSYGALADFKRTSTTGLQKLGNGSVATAYAGGSATNFVAEVVVGDMGAAPYYLSMTGQLGAAVESVTLQDWIVRLTPYAV